MYMQGETGVRQKSGVELEKLHEKPGAKSKLLTLFLAWLIRPGRVDHIMSERSK